MGKPIKTESGAWKVQIQVKGKRVAKTFQTRAEALDWAANQRLAANPVTVAGITFYDLCCRWHERFGESRAHSVREKQRIEWNKDDPLFKTRLRDLSGKSVADWRDRALQRVSGSSVNRDWNLFSAICTDAIREMDLLAENPFSKAKRPPEATARTRIPTDAELAEIQRWCNPHVWNVVTFAIETGMRLSEISGLRWEDVTGKTALLKKTKNGEAREVPLSAKAIKAMGEPGIGSVFGLTSPQIYYHWRDAVKAAGVEGLTFHDNRALAATRLSKVLHPLQLARMMGWKSVSMALVYYRESAADIATQIDQKNS